MVKNVGDIDEVRDVVKCQAIANRIVQPVVRTRMEGIRRGMECVFCVGGSRRFGCRYLIGSLFSLTPCSVF